MNISLRTFVQKLGHDPEDLEALIFPLDALWFRVQVYGNPRIAQYLLDLPSQTRVANLKSINDFSGKIDGKYEVRKAYRYGVGKKDDTGFVIISYQLCK